MSAWLAIAFFIATPFLEVRQFPAHERGASYFMAPLSREGAPGLFCLQGGNVHVYSLEEGGAPRIFVLPEGTTAVDAFDLNGDGAVEIIVIAGRRVMRMVVAAGSSPAGVPAEPQELFRASSQFAEAESQPFLHVLGVIWQGQRVLGIPDEESYTLYGARGEIVATWPIGSETRPQTAMGRPFAASVAAVSTMGPPGALEMRLRREIAIQPALPEALPIAPPVVIGKTTAPAAYVNEGENYLYWPAFGLATTETATGQPEELRRAQVLHAFDMARGPRTVVRLQTPGRTGDSGAYRVEPEMHYPGLRVGAEFSAPDFNRDGLADLLLWRDAGPVSATSRLSKSLVTGTRTIRMAAHSFDPKRRRFSPEPDSHFSVEVPAGWAAGGSHTPPLRHVLVADINGDGATDFAMATGEAAYAVWLYGEEGFGGAPDWHHTFSAPLEELLFHGKFGGNGEGFALRTRDYVYTLLPPPVSQGAATGEPTAPVRLP
jgi:hypothetical protein